MTTTDLTPEQIHEIGLKQITQIEAEMLALTNKLGYKDLASANEHIKNERQFYATSGQQLLDLYTKYARQMEPELPKLPKVVVHQTRPTVWFRSLPAPMRHNVKQVCKLQADDPCAGKLKPFSDANPDPAVALLADMTDDQRAGVSGYCDQVNRGKPGCNTPLVVAFEIR